LTFAEPSIVNYKYSKFTIFIEKLKKQMDIKTIIKNKGHISISELMGYALPIYYGSRQPFGKGGDFITAPEISQVFGELIGVFIAYQWINMGTPSSVALVEMGPGRGVLMKDLLRGTRRVKGFHEAIDIHMVENSLQLQQVQKETLEGMHGNIKWHDNINTIPRKKSFFVANEFFDALPINQYVKTKEGWCENLIFLDKNEKLRFGLSPVCGFSDEFNKKHPFVKEGDVLEVSQSSLAIVKDIAKRIKEFGGAGVFIDYGYDYYGYKDTLQGMKNHKFHDVLKNIGEADITAHVDFVALSEAVKEQGIDDCSIVTQREFLMSLGIEKRREILVAGAANKKQAKRVSDCVERLIDVKNMGSLFKVLVSVEGKFGI